MLQHHLLRLAAPCEVLCFGDSSEDVPKFMDSVIRKGDIAILDQNLDFPQEHVLGTDLVAQLLDSGFPGLLCIRSANNSERDKVCRMCPQANFLLPGVRLRGQGTSVF